MLRLACLLAIAALLPLVALFARPSGRTAIVFTFVGTPLLAAALLLGLLSWARHSRGRNDATTAPGSRAGSHPDVRP